MKDIWFIRHAESISNAGLVTEYSHNIGITKNGQEQAETLADSIDQKPDLIFCSSYQRTSETAMPLSRRYRVPIEIFPDIHEFDFLNSVDFVNTNQAQREPYVKKYWNKCDPNYKDGDQAESFNEFRARISNCLEILKSRPENFIIVFCHGYVIRLIWQLLFTNIISIEYFKYRLDRTTLHNCEILKWQMEKNK